MNQEIVPACPHAGVCGGCLWQHLAYPSQLELKKQAINQAFSQAGHLAHIEAVVPSPEIFYYRNRMDYAIGWKGEVGLKQKGLWNRYVDLSTCLLLDKETPEILSRVRQLIQELDLPPWDVKFHRGLVRYCVIRVGKNTGERMITLVVKDLSRIVHHTSRIIERLGPLCSTLYLGENPEITDLSICKTLHLLQGPEYLTEEVNGIKYLIHPNSFFQTNTIMAGELQKTVLNFTLNNAPLTGDAQAGTPYRPQPSGELGEDVWGADAAGPGSGEKIMDLYCGSGFFGIACAKKGMSVRGYELDAQAIDLAKKNARSNGVADRTSFEAGAVEHVLPDIAADEVVILDPPRSGLHPKVLKALLEIRPKHIVYVSCKYQRLVEELKEFSVFYDINQLTALDLFPHTPHVEVVANLTLRH